MAERQAGARVISFFRVIGIELLLAPFGVGQRATVGALYVGDVWPLPNAIQVERPPGSLGSRTFGRLISATAAAFRPTLAAPLTCSRSTLRLLSNQSCRDQARGRDKHQTVFHGDSCHVGSPTVRVLQMLVPFFARIPSSTISSPSFTESCVKPARVMALGEPSSHCHFST